MNPKSNLFNTILAFVMSAVIFSACQKSDVINETQSTMSTAGIESQSTMTETQVTTTDDASAGISAKAANLSPSIKTGPDQTYSTAVSSITLDGSGSSDPDGSITSYLWTKDFGNGGAITSPNSAITTVTGLTAGQYRFKLKITDNSGTSVTDTIHISNGNGSAPPANQAPVANAGANQTITSPASSVTLSGSATDADGTIVSYLWTKVSGTGGTITSPNAASTTVTGLTVGTYVYNLQAIDNRGAGGNKTVSITVNAAGTNQIPVVNAGANQTITLPVSSVTLSGSATDADGSIASYLWTKVSGNGGTITSPNAASTTVTGLTAGAYVYNLKATDNRGAAGNKTVNITVSAVNQVPVVNAGANQTISLPVSSVTLSGSATDADGSIASYLWTKVSGNGSTITSPNAASTTVTGLTAGSYVYNLKATDNKGAVGNKTVTITVNAVNQVPVVNAGANKTITLPVSSVSLSGSATDADGTIASYLWTKVSGNGGTIASPNAATTNVTGLTAGSYVFNLKATDNRGAAGNKTVTVTVNAATPPAGNYGTLIYSTGYNQLSDITTNNGQYGDGTVSTTVYKTGPGSFYSRPSEVSQGTRSEVQYSEAQTPIEGVIEYDVMYEVVIPNNGHSLQFHPNTSGGSAALALYHTGGKFDVNRWYDGDNYHQTGTLMTIQTNRWYSMRLEYKFNNTSGYYRWYIDNVLYYSYTGKVGDGSGQYLKVGYNGWDANSTSSRIYYDNLKIWRR